MALRVRPRAPQDENAAMPHLSGSKSALKSVLEITPFDWSDVLGRFFVIVRHWVMRVRVVRVFSACVVMRSCCICTASNW